MNGLRVSTTGLRECSERVAERAEWKNKFQASLRSRRRFRGQLYISGAGLPIYWNDMPHSGVQIKLDRSGGVAVFAVQSISARDRIPFWHTLSPKSSASIPPT